MYKVTRTKSRRISDADVAAMHKSKEFKECRDQWTSALRQSVYRERRSLRGSV